jgi:putative ABC transport system ATP-binding protein
VTHDPKAAARAQRLVHLEKGVLVDEVDADPAGPPVAGG